MVKSFYFDETQSSGILNLVRGHNLELDDQEFLSIAYVGDPAVSQDYDDDINQHVSLVVDGSANLDNNTCNAWLAIDTNYSGESTYNKVVDAGRVGLRDFIGKPMYFNVLPDDPEPIRTVTGKSYDVSNSAANTAYTTTLLQNINTQTEINKFTPESVEKVHLINELAYGRKYCIIPYETVIDNSLGSDESTYTYSKAYAAGEITQAAVTQATLADSDVLADFDQVVSFDDANELFLAPADITPAGAYDAGGVATAIQGNYELRIDVDRFHNESDYRGDGRKSYVRFHLDTLRDEELRSNEGFFVNGQKVSGVFSNIRIRYDADIYDSDGDRDYYEDTPIDSADFIDSLNAFYTLYQLYDEDDEYGVEDVELDFAIEFNQANWPQKSDGSSETLGWKLGGSPLLQNDHRLNIEFETDSGSSQSSTESDWYNPFTQDRNNDDLLVIKVELFNSSGSGRRYVQNVSQESGIKTLGFNAATAKIINNVPNDSDFPNAPTVSGGSLSVEKEGTKDSIDLPNVLKAEEDFRYTEGLVVTRNVDNNTYKGYLYAEDNAASLYNTIKAISLITLDSNGAEVSTYTYKSGSSGFTTTTVGSHRIISFNTTSTVYNAFNTATTGQNIKVKLYTSTTISNANLLTYELADKNIPIKVAYGFSRIDGYRLPYFEDDSGGQQNPAIMSEGNLDITLQDNENLQAFGYMRRQKNNNVVRYVPFMLLSNDSRLSALDTIYGYFGGTEIAMNRLDYASPQRNVVTAFLGPESSSVPSNFSSSASYTFEYADASKSKQALIPALSANRIAKIYAKCAIFELGVPSLAVNNGIRTIGGNNYDGKNNVIRRVVTGISDPFTAATGIGKTAIAAKKGLVVRQSTSEEGHSNNILARLADANTSEAKQLLIQSGYSLSAAIAASTQRIGTDMFKLIRDPINASKLGTNGATFIANSSYGAVSDYLGLEDDDGSVESTTGLTYEREILNLDGSELNPIDLVTSYTNDRIFASTNRGIFSLTYGHNQLADFTVNLTTRSKPKIKPFVFNNKISCVTSNNTILNVLDSEERRGYRDKFSGQDQKHLLEPVEQGIFDYSTNNFYFSRKDGKITVALNIDEEVIGFSHFTFFQGDDDQRSRIRCKKLINTDSDVKGLFEYDKYDPDTTLTTTETVIASFSNDLRVDFEGDNSGIEGMEDLLYLSEVQSNPLVLTGVTGTEGFLFPVGAQKISVSTSGVDDLMVGMADPGNADNPLFKQYFEARYGPDPVPVDFTVDSNFSWHTYLILLQIKKESAGVIQGFQAQGVIDGVR